MIRRYSPEDSDIAPTLGFMCGPHHFVEPGFELHTHEFIEMVLVLKGKGLHLTSYGNYVINAGDVFVVKPAVAHGFAESAGMDIVNFLFTSSFLEESSRSLKQLAGYHALFVLEPVYRQKHGIRNRLHLTAAQLKTTTRQVDEISFEFQERNPGYQAMIRGKWQQLLTWLCRVFCDLGGIPAPVARLAGTIAFIEQNFTQKLSLEEMSNRAHLSKNQFIRVFKKHYNMTPYRYICQLRVDKARELLSESHLSITDIAGQCGYEDSNHFSRSFRQITGGSPKSYRLKNYT